MPPIVTLISAPFDGGPDVAVGVYVDVDVGARVWVSVRVDVGVSVLDSETLDVSVLVGVCDVTSVGKDDTVGVEAGVSEAVAVAVSESVTI